MSSRIDHERGCVVLTTTGGEPGYEAGRTFWPPGCAPVEYELTPLELEGRTEAISDTASNGDQAHDPHRDDDAFADDVTVPVR